MKAIFDIDFVVSWVDGKDPDWREKRAKFQRNPVPENRYRDYGLLKNWFERVWKYAPWVNNVFLVTDNQATIWALSDDRITIVNHTDFIPDDYLPTFNSSVIEMFLWNIKGLVEHFVYFNDDMFLTNQVLPTDFFDKKGCPVLTGSLNSISPTDDVSKNMFQNMILVNRLFDKKSLLNNPVKYLNVRYSFSNNVRTILNLPYTKWMGFYEDHLAYPNLKSWFIKLNETNPNVFNQMGKHKFRHPEDYTIWLLKNMYLASGKFAPRHRGFGKVINVKSIEDILIVKKSIANHKMIVVNDDISDDEFEECIKYLRNALALTEL